MKSLLPSKPGTAYEAQRTGRTEVAVEEARRTAVASAAPGPLTSFSRFVLCGGGVGLASGPAVALLATLMPWASANALVTAGSTILCTELHARFTFKAGRRAGWHRHWQSAGSALAAYTVTCAAMFILHLMQPSAGTLSEQAVYLSASGIAGIGRFLVLRLVVFAGSSTTGQEGGSAGVQEASDVAAWSIATPPEPKTPQSVSERVLRGARAATMPTARARPAAGRSGRSASAPRPLRSPVSRCRAPAVLLPTRGGETHRRCSPGGVRVKARAAAGQAVAGPAVWSGPAGRRPGDTGFLTCDGACPPSGSRWHGPGRVAGRTRTASSTRCAG